MWYLEWWNWVAFHLVIILFVLWALQVLAPSFQN